MVEIQMIQYMEELETIPYLVEMLMINYMEKMEMILFIVMVE
jgi:hypothetical protein